MRHEDKDTSGPLGRLQILKRIFVFTATVVIANIPKESPFDFTLSLAPIFPSIVGPVGKRAIQEFRARETQFPLMYDQTSWAVSAFSITLIGFLICTIGVGLALAGIDATELFLSVFLNLFLFYFFQAFIRWLVAYSANKYPKSSFAISPTQTPELRHNADRRSSTKSTADLADPLVEAEIQEFQEQLSTVLVPDGVSALTPSGLSRHPRYTHCFALFIVFALDNLGGCLSEAQALGKELQEGWGFEPAVIYKIPLKNAGTLQKTVEKEVANFIETHDSCSNLLLVHYGGHGFINETDEYELFMEHKEKFYEIRLKPIRELLLRSCKSDVAILLDSCNAEAGIYRSPDLNTVEILTACMEKEKTPPVGPNSFTAAVLRVLRGCDRDSLTLDDLLLQLRKDSLAANPVYKSLRVSTQGPIVIRRSIMTAEDDPS